MKNLSKSVLTAATVVSASLFMMSCQKDVSAKQAGSVSSQAASRLTASVTYPLLAGQTIPSGTIVVNNDAANVYITYNAAAGWKFTSVHLKVEDNATTQIITNPDIAPGQFPYQATFTGAYSQLPSTYTFTVPVSSYTTAAIYAHAGLVKSTDGVNISGSESGWGGSILHPSGLKWYGKIVYIIGDNVDDDK